jgi:Tfp pilus assembly protein PilF
MWALFFLLSFLGYTRSRDTRGRRSGWLRAASLAAYLLALLSKESAVTLLGVIVVYDFLYGDEKARRLGARLRGLVVGRWRAYAGFVLVTVLYLGIRSFALGWGQTLPPPIHLDNPIVTLDLPWRVLNALQVAFRYLGLQFFPLHLSYDYSYNQIPLITSLADPRAWLVLGLCGAALGILAWSYRFSKVLFFALIFYLATFSPVSNLVIVIGTIMGERLVYVPSVGFCLALALVLRGLCGKFPQARTGSAVFIGIFALIVGLHSMRTVTRNGDWKTQERLYLHDMHVVPNSSKVLNNAAAMSFGRKEYEKSLDLFRRAIEIEPHYAQPYRTAGFVYTETGRDEEAMEMYNLAIRYGATDAKLYNNMGFLLVDHEVDMERGITLLEKAVEKRPKHPDFLDSLAWGYYKLGRLEEARDLLRKSLRINRRSPSTQSRRDHLKTIEDALAGKSPLDRLQMGSPTRSGGAPVVELEGSLE